MIHARPDYQDLVELEKRIPDEEPVFLLRGQDPHAGALLRLWANLNRIHGGDPVLSRLAEQQADRMDQWPVKKKSDFVTR